jgi:hypothetical protein
LNYFIERQESRKEAGNIPASLRASLIDLSNSDVARVSWHESHGGRRAGDRDWIGEE